MSLMLGDEYISKARRPLRTRNSIAAKSFLLIWMFFSNSALANDSKCGRVSYSRTLR